jgi:hypothetical protein
VAFSKDRTGRVASAPDTSFGHFGAQTLHEVQPTATGRSEVDVIARVARQPRSHHRDLVGSVRLSRVAVIMCVAFLNDGVR